MIFKDSNPFRIYAKTKEAVEYNDSFIFSIYTQKYDAKCYRYRKYGVTNLMSYRINFDAKSRKSR